MSGSLWIIFTATIRQVAYHEALHGSCNVSSVNRVDVRLCDSGEYDGGHDSRHKKPRQQNLWVKTTLRLSQSSHRCRSQMAPTFQSLTALGFLTNGVWSCGHATVCRRPRRASVLAALARDMLFFGSSAESVGKTSPRARGWRRWPCSQRQSLGTQGVARPNWLKGRSTVARLSVERRSRPAASRRPPACGRRFLAGHEGALSFDGLTTLSDECASALAKCPHGISLDGIKTLSDQSAESLSLHDGSLWLN